MYCLWICTYIEKDKTMYGYIKHKIQHSDTIGKGGKEGVEWD